jgi:addiction module antitoxin, RelB/DinJ family
MANTALVQAKIDPWLKEEAEKRFSLFGLDSATAIRMFFAKVVQTDRIPFTVGLDDDIPGEYETTPEEDAYDAQVAKEAYEEYIASGCKSRPFSELLKETGIQ